MFQKRGGAGKKPAGGARNAKKLHKKAGAMKASSSRGANPFDVRSNARVQKHEVLGRRVKGAGRNVAAARAEAERKRHKTLGAEFRARNKSNAFRDKRLGEQDASMTLEDKMIARFQTERKRKLRVASASTFALHDSDSEQDDEDALFLTHKGAKIGDDYDQLNADGPLEDEDDTEEGRQMDREIVNSLHFGGGKNDADAPAPEDGSGKRKTHKEVMQEVMMKAKLYKAERQKNKSTQEDATEQLDEGFADLRNLLEFRPTRANGKEILPKEPLDDFDKLTREFAFEAKAKATERRLSPEEAAKKEHDRLAELEKKRVARMHGADDDSDSESEDGGKRKGRKKGKKSKEKAPQLIMMPPTDDDLMDSYEVDQRFAGQAEGDGDEDNAEEEDVEEEEHAEEEESEEEADSEAMDSDDEVEKGEEKEEEGEEGEEGEEEEEEEDEEAEKKARELDAEAAAKELPFVFPCPESPEDLQKLFKQHARTSAERRGQILERVITYYSPRLSAANQSKMKRFFAVLLRQFLLFAGRYAAHKQDLDSLTSSLFSLAQQMPEAVGVVVRELLAQLYKRLHRRNKNPSASASASAWPTLPELLLFKALTAIFPTSDLRHNVVSPLETLLGESLARGSLGTPQEASQALFAASLSLDITRAKQRFMPEVVSCLTRLLRAFATSASTVEAQKASIPDHWLRRELLEWLEAEPEAAKTTELPRLSLSATSSCSAVQVLSASLALLDVATTQYASLASFDELFYPQYLLLHALGTQTRLPAVHASVAKLHTLLSHCWSARRPLRLQSFAPKTLPTFAPHFDENYTVRKDKTASKDQAQLKQLQRQVKRARKGAARELRRDAEFIHREKQKEEDARLQAKEEKQQEIRRWLQEQNATFNQQVRKGGHMLKGGGSAHRPAPRARASKK